MSFYRSGLILASQLPRESSAEHHKDEGNEIQGNSDLPKGTQPTRGSATDHVGFENRLRTFSCWVSRITKERGAEVSGFF